MKTPNCLVLPTHTTDEMIRSPKQNQKSKTNLLGKGRLFVLIILIIIKNSLEKRK